MSNIINIHKAHLARDSKFSTTTNGKKVCNFVVGTNDGFGERQTTLWFDCALWGDRAEKASTLLLKGKEVGIIGRVKPIRLFEKDGKHGGSYQIDVIDFVLHGKKDENAFTASQPSEPAPSADLNDDIPF